MNLLEIDDSVQGRAPGAPNTRNPRGHSHREQEEAYIVVAGSGRVRLGDELHDLRRWDVVRVAPEVVRAFESGPEASI